MCHGMSTKQLLQNLCENHLTTLQSCTSLISLFDSSYSYISNDFILSTLVDHNTCFFLNISKIVNHSYILLHNSQFGTSYRSIIQNSFIRHNLYYHKLALTQIEPEEDPYECCSRCFITSNALSSPADYIDADEYDEFDYPQFPHTPITLHHTPTNISSVSHPLSRVTFNIFDDKIAAKDIPSSNITPTTLQHTPNNTSSVSRPLSHVTINIIDDKTDLKHLSSLNTTPVIFDHNTTSFQHIPIT